MRVSNPNINLLQSNKWYVLQRKLHFIGTFLYVTLFSLIQRPKKSDNSIHIAVILWICIINRLLTLKSNLQILAWVWVEIRFGIVTHLDRVTHIICSDNDLSRGRCQDFLWIYANLLLIVSLTWKNRDKIQTRPLTEMSFNMSFAKWRPFCLGRSALSG